MRQWGVYIWLCGVLGAAAPIYAEVFFSDNFNRPDSMTISASSVGMSGTLAPLQYIESFEGSGAAASIQILNNQLQMAVGQGMSNAFLDYNFTASAVGEGGGFSISLDIVEINSAATDSANRFMGFGLGMTREEALGAGDINDSPATYRGGGGAVGVCDFFVDVAIDGTLRIWSRGTLLRTVSAGSSAGTLQVVFTASGFDAGDSVGVTVFFNGTVCDQRTFSWSHSNANYIGLSGRASERIRVDNFIIDSVVQLPPAVILTETDGETLVKEGGFSDDILLSMNTSPMVFPLTIDIADIQNPNQVTVSPAQIVYTAADWQSLRTVTITAIDDDAMERAIHETFLRFVVTAQPDSPYYGFADQELVVQIMDNDCGSWGFSPADFNLDCQVNLEDFAYFVLEWISCSIPDPLCQDFRY